jgi:hypothetical protein
LGALAKLEGLQLHPVSFRKIRGDAAELDVLPQRKGATRPRVWSHLPWRGKQNRGVFGPDTVLFRRIFEHLNSTPGQRFSQGETERHMRIYRAFIQRFTGGLEKANRAILRAAEQVTKRDTFG